MTPEQVPEYLSNMLDRVYRGSSTRVILVGATALKAQMIDRIFSEGKDSADGKIGDYSTKPAYFEEEQFVRKGAFQPQGKGGFKGQKLVSENKYKVVKKKLKSGRVEQRLVSEKKYKVVKDKPQSMYLKGGYAEFREIQGRQAATKDFFLSGSLKNNIQIGEENGATVIGLTDERESKKRHGLEFQVGKNVFPPSASDLAAMEEAIDAEIDAIIAEDNDPHY